MRNTFTRIVAGSALLFATGCAGGYTAIRPTTVTSYTSVTSANSPVEFSYQYGALSIHGRNKKYNKKERKRGYQTVAVKVKNNTDQELNFSRDLELYFGDRPVAPVPSVQAANDLKQGVAIYLLYLLLNFNVGGTTTVNSSTGQTTTSGGTFIPTGPFIAGGNMIGASQANKNLRLEFAQHDLTNKSIKPGETVYGIISLREMNVAPLHLVLRNSSAATRPSTTPASPAQAPAPAQAVPANGGQK
ncbi:hypothetical protein LGH70_09150 [Hymenobacter sp. BT635]|uniref:Uncharacterized protein n=1 Tax=Hymenobacter nitidus TaxID=2880929 RepID=A0ABS8ABS9_9BACT|nr:hypothetical protein [Hymenobacter nitidus]MCB2377746.1 hypothetical protein [Hymenobacter nitidus]